MGPYIMESSRACQFALASIDQGQWYDPDSQEVDHGGCANMLTLDKSSPAGSFTSNTCLVQIEKA